jgi:tyrosyl-tRNA synthetase
MTRAFCPERTIAFNPVIDICKHIVFREKTVFTIERPSKFGGNIEFHSFTELEAAYSQGKLHPQDLKNGVAAELAEILEPVRRYFANNTDAQKCLDAVRAAKITR